MLELGDFLEADTLKGPVVNPFLVDRMEAEGTAAILPSVLELNAWPRFQQLLAGRSIPLLLSNVYHRSEGGRQPLAERSLIVTVNGVRIGLVGVMGPLVFAKVKAPAGMELEIDDPVAIIRELAPALRVECDLVAVLACMDDRDALAMAKDLSDVDLVLGGYQSIPSDRPMLAGRVVVSRSGMRGQVLNTTRIIVSPAGEIVDWFGCNYALTARYPADPAVDSLVAVIADRADLARARGIQTLLREKASASPGDGTEAAEPITRYIGAQACGACHGEPYRQWSGTAHARAFDPVAGLNVATAGDQIARRVTGFGVPGGYRADRETPDLRHVQCEACHGPGSAHVRGAAARPVAEETCRRCHDPGAVQGWNFDTALGRIRH